MLQKGQSCLPPYVSVHRNKYFRLTVADFERYFWAAVFYIKSHAEYEAEATWSTRSFTPFVMQRISVATQLAAASEIRQALGMGLAAARA